MARFALALGALVAVGAGRSQVAGAKSVINIIRHGEKCGDKDNGLSPEGQARAEYLAECMSSAAVSRAMPHGMATAVMASKLEVGKTTRPHDTIAPLADKLGLEVQMPCLKGDSSCFATEVHRLLSDGGTVVVAWTNDEIPAIRAAIAQTSSHLNTTLGVGHDWAVWPHDCPSQAWDEPACASKGKACYDEIWQVTFDGTESGEWIPTSSQIFREGFSGLWKGPCHADLVADQGFIAEAGSCQMKEARDSCGTGLECERRPLKTGNRICVKAAEIDV